MRRRDFITLITDAAAWPSLVSAQTARQRPIVGTITTGTQTQYQGLRLRQAFLDGMRVGSPRESGKTGRPTGNINQGLAVDDYGPRGLRIDGVPQMRSGVPPHGGHEPQQAGK